MAILGLLEVAFRDRFAGEGRLGFSSQKLLLDLMVRFTTPLVESSPVKQRAITTVG